MMKMKMKMKMKMTTLITIMETPKTAPKFGGIQLLLVSKSRNKGKSFRTLSQLYIFHISY